MNVTEIRRPADMERINTPELAQAFIDEQIALIKEQVGDKKVLLALLFFVKHFSLKKRQNSLFLAKDFPCFRQDVLCILGEYPKVCVNLQTDVR